MKLKFNILNCISVMIASLVLSSCAQELVAEQGTPNDPDCYGIYFPSQDGTGDIQIDPSDPKTLTFTVRRINTRGAVTVPVTIVSEHEGIFSTQELYFEEDAPTAELSVYFPTVKMGVKYDCTIKIEGDEYVSQYSQNPSHISFSVTCVKWNKLGTGRWRDGVFAEWFNLANPNLERSIDIYERDDLPGYYRLYDVYGTEFMTNMFGMNASSVCIEKNYTYIDATDPEKVWIPTFKTGVVLNAEYGEMSIASYVTENKEFDASISPVYGTLKDGVITFPTNSIQLHFALLGWYPTNTYGLHRVILPGYRALDHSLEVTPGITGENGELPIDIKMGQDIETLKLYVTDEELAGSVAASLAEQLAKGTLKSDIPDMTQSGTLNLALDKTGIYTLLAVGLDTQKVMVDTVSKLQKDTVVMVQYVAKKFGYKTSAEEKPVQVNCGLITSDKYAPEGKTSENSLELYINGTDLEKVCVALHEKEKYDTYTEDCLKALESAVLTDESLALVNGNGLSLVQTGLVPGTEYILLVKAYNGYSEDLITAVAKTNGQWDYRLAYYTTDDIDFDATMNVIDVSDYFGTYNYYAVDFESSSRYCLGEVEIGSSKTDYQGQPCASVSGLFPYMDEYYNVEDDAVEFYYYQGYIWNYKMRSDYFIYEGMYIYTQAMLYGTDGGAYNGAGGLVAAFVKKQNRPEAKPCIAFLDSGAGASIGLSFTGLALLGYEDSSYTSFIGLLDLVDNMILVPKEDDPDPIYKKTPVLDEEVEETKAQMLQLMREAPSWNLVETDEGLMMSVIDRLHSTRNIKNYFEE